MGGNGVYVNPLKDADRLAQEEGRGGEWGQLAKALETILRQPGPFVTWCIYVIITLWFKYT